MNIEDEDLRRDIEYRHKIINRFLELTKDFKKLDKKMLLAIPTDDLIELGKAMAQPYKLLEELKQKKSTLRDALAKEPSIGKKEK
jgi:hypothetical protein